MTKRLLSLGWASILALASLSARAQTPVTLPSGTSYTENFNGLGNNDASAKNVMPDGFGVYTGATTTSLGTAATVTLAPGSFTYWTNVSAGFKNFASANVGSGTSTTNQGAATDRALGVRQTAAAGYEPTATGTQTGGPSFVFQVANTTGRAGFALNFNLQSLDAGSTRTTTWVVDYGFGAAPTSFTQVASGTTGGSKFSNTPIKAIFGSALNDRNGTVTIRISALTPTANTGNRPSSAIDDFTLSWTPNSAPQLDVAPNALSFSGQPLGSTGTAQTYQLKPANLTDATTVTASGPFLVSKDGSAGSFSSSLTYAAGTLTAPTNVYVQFAPTAVGSATGSVSNVSGPASASVALSGSAYDPANTNFTFDQCTGTTNLSDGWKQYSVAGDQTWACTTFGRDPNNLTSTSPSPYGVQMNGYVNGLGNVANEDWLISPSLNLSATTYPLLSFWSRTAFNGDPLRLLVSTNYSGSGDPYAQGVTWTDLNATFPVEGSDRWTQTQYIDLAAYKTTGVYVAFVYNSTIDDGARWTVDDVVLTNSAVPAPPAVRVNPSDISFGYQPVNTPGQQTLNVTGTNLTGNLTLTSSGGAFQLSKDGSSFGSTLTYTAAEASGGTLAPLVRFLPTTASTSYAGTVSISSPSVTPLTVTLGGNSYDVANTLEVVNWNMEWFGSADPAFGPKDKDLQNTNATKIINALNADVYALVEVVDTMRLRNIVAQMPGYAYRVGDYGSGADDKFAPKYNTDQKLAFVYRTSVVSNPKFQVFFRSKEADGKPDYSWWASGRFPFVMTADVTLNGTTKPVTFVALHAKANTSPTATSYARRKSASDELKAYLDANYAGANVMVLGDINDDLDQTITTGLTTTATSYSAFTNDAANYPSPTLQELSLAGKKSTVKYADPIDHVITTKQFYSYYIKGTTAAQLSLAATIPNYGTTTSDHYPVLTRYSFDAPDLVVNTANQTVAGGTYNNVTVTGTGSGSLQGPLVVNGSLTVQSGGGLVTNCQPITGNGTFTLADGARLFICDANGIATTGNTGAVQVTGTRSFSPAATYLYNGLTAQVTGSGLPSQVRELVSANANTLTLSQPLAVDRGLYVVGKGNVALNGQALTLLSSASGTALVVNSGGGAVIGTATVQRYLDGSLNAGLGYRQLSAPVSGSNVADLTTASFSPVVNPSYNTSATPGTTRPYPTVYGYDESRLSTATNNLQAFDKGWFSPASLTDALTVGKGYTMNLAANQVIDFVGTLNNGDLTQSLTRQDQTNDGGWQLLGNPYPSPLDWSQVAAADRTGLDGAVYISQSTGQYAGTYRSSVNNVGGGSVIPVGQGFFARVTQGQNAASLTLRNSQRVTDYTTQVSVLRTTADLRPRLNLTLGTPGGNLDGLYVYAEAGATPGFDAQQDAAKLPNTNGLNLAALTPSGQPLSIQGLAALNGRVALRVQAPAAGTYTLAAAELLNLPAGTTVVLEDTQTGQHTPLAATGAAYTFTVAAGDKVDGRFWLNLTAASPLATLPGALQTALTLYPNPSHDGQATLLVPTSLGAGQVQVLDALGRLVRQQALAAGGRTTLQLAGLPAGVYVVRVQTNGEQATRRLTLN